MTNCLLRFVWHSGVIVLYLAFFVYGSVLFLFSCLISFILSLVYSKHSPKKKFVVIGGGFSGAYAAKKLEQHFDLTFIDNKDYFEFTPSVPRTLVEPNHVKQMQIKHSDYLDLSKTQVINDKVFKLDESSVWLKKGDRKIDYDCLLICTGSTYNKPFKSDCVLKATRSKKLISKFKEFQKANKVLVIGGGIVGVEAAAEIVETFPQKQVTLIHSGHSLMNRTSGVTPKLANYAYDWLTKRGCKVVLGQRAEHQPCTTERLKFVTQKGALFAPDVVLMCTGIVPNSKFLQGTFLASACNQSGFIKANPFLQVLGQQNVFVCGDVASLDEEKLAQNAERSASVVVHNALALFVKQKRKRMIKYSVVDRPMVISLGKYCGIFLYKGWSLTGFIPSWMKVVVEMKVMVSYKFRTGFTFFW